MRCYICGDELVEPTLVKSTEADEVIEVKNIEYDKKEYPLCPRCFRMALMLLHFIKGDGFPFMPEDWE